MPSWARKLTLTLHIAASVGWLGAVIVFLALAVIALSTPDIHTTRAVYTTMHPAAWTTLVPLATASLVTGITQSLTTSWGILRHYWVAFKLLINVAALLVLLAYIPTFGHLARAAADDALPHTDLIALGWSPLLHASLALAALAVATVLAVYKPRGVTRLGLKRGALSRVPGG